MGCSSKAVFGAVLICLGTALALVSNGTLYWKTRDDDRNALSQNFGLYRGCVEYGGDSKCGKLKDPEDHVLLTRSLVSVSIVLTVIGSILSLVHLCKVPRKTVSRGMVIAITVLCCISVVLLALANVVYGTQYQEENQNVTTVSWELHYSFYVNAVAAVALLFGAIFMRTSYSPEQTQIQTGAIIAHQPPGIPLQNQQTAHPAYPAYAQPQQAYYTPTSGQAMPPAYGQPNQYPAAANPGFVTPYGTKQTNY